MEYGFEHAFPDAMEGVAEGALIGGAGIITGIFLILYLLLLGVAIVFYVLYAVGMYRIAKRRGIHHAWLAWIPVGCNWLLGSISDHYQYVAKQKVTKRRKIMLTLSIISVIAGAVVIGGVAALVIAEVSGANMAASILAVAVMVIAYLALIGLGIAITVFAYISCFDLFRSCRPENDVLFLLLSILLGAGIFVFACSSYDKGMPPKRPPQQPPVQIPYQPVEEEIPTVEAEVVEDSEF